MRDSHCSSFRDDTKRTLTTKFPVARMIFNETVFQVHGISRKLYIFKNNLSIGDQELASHAVFTFNVLFKLAYLIVTCIFFV